MAKGQEMLLSAALNSMFKLLGMDTPEKKEQMGALIAHAQNLPALLAEYKVTQAAMVQELKALRETVSSMSVGNRADALKAAALANVQERCFFKPIVGEAANSGVYEDWLMENAGPAAFGAAFDALDDPANIGYGKSPNSNDAIAEVIDHGG